MTNTGTTDGYIQSLEAEVERLRAALNDIAQMSFSPRPTGMSDLDWAICNLRTLQAYAAETLAVNEQIGVTTKKDERGWPIQEHQHLFEGGICVGCGRTEAEISDH